MGWICTFWPVDGASRPSAVAHVHADMCSTLGQKNTRSPGCSSLARICSPWFQWSPVKCGRLMPTARRPTSPGPSSRTCSARPRPTRTVAQLGLSANRSAWAPIELPTHRKIGVVAGLLEDAQRLLVDRAVEDVLLGLDLGDLLGMAVVSWLALAASWLAASRARCAAVWAAETWLTLSPFSCWSWSHDRGLVRAAPAGCWSWSSSASGSGSRSCSPRPRSGRSGGLAGLEQLLVALGGLPGDLLLAAGPAGAGSCRASYCSPSTVDLVRDLLDLGQRGLQAAGAASPLSRASRRPFRRAAGRPPGLAFPPRLWSGSRMLTRCRRVPRRANGKAAGRAGDACHGASAPRGVSSPRPPTGLADGFGLEEPYGGQSPRGRRRPADSPRGTWVPGSPDAQRGRELGGSWQPARIGSAATVVTAMEINRIAQCRRSQNAKFFAPP